MQKIHSREATHLSNTDLCFIYAQEIEARREPDTQPVGKH